jgi:hypothetical protein
MRDSDDRTGPESAASARRLRVKLRLRAMRMCPPWERPLRKVHDNVTSSFILISTALTLMRTSRRHGAHRPRWRAHQLNQAGLRLTLSADHIHRATDNMQEANAAIASSAEPDSAGAERLAADAQRMLRAAAALSMVTMRLEAAVADAAVADAAVADAAVADAVLLERSGQVADERPEITPPPPVIRPFPDDSPPLPLGRRRSVLGTIEDAIRRVCRGRAPPMVSLCPL